MDDHHTEVESDCNDGSALKDKDSHHPPQQEREQQGTNPKDFQMPGRWGRIFASLRGGYGIDRKVELGLLFFMVVFTGLLVAVGYLQWRATQEATIAANESVRVSKVTQRANVSVGNVVISNDISIKKLNGILITLENTGGLATQTLSIKGQVFRENQANEKIPDGGLINIDLKETSIPKGASRFPVEIAINSWTDKKRMEAIRRGAEIIYVYGMICYKDGLNEMQSTMFAFRHETRWIYWPLYSSSFQYVKCS